MAYFPDISSDSNLARYFLYDRIKEDLGGKNAILFGERGYTYLDVAERSHGFANLLMDTDIRRGERVLVSLPDVPPFAWCIFGILERGSVLAMANPLAPAETLEYLVKYTRATAVITVPDVAVKLESVYAKSKLGRDLRRIWVVPDAATGEDPEASCGIQTGDMIRELAVELGNASTRPVNVETHCDEPAIWLFTSGSTGRPKANVHCHRDFIFNTELYAKKTVGYERNDVSISVPRLFFGYATGTNLFFPFAAGATVGLFSERPSPESIKRAVSAYRPTIVTNVPTMLRKLLDYDRRLRKKGENGLDFSSVRFSLSAGEALPGPLLDRWLGRFKSDVYDGIGSAEMFHIYASNRPGDVRPGSLGRAVEGYELRILPEGADGPGAAACGPGEIGVLWVKGDSVATGYWMDRIKSWKTFHGHWCCTGDLFHMDEGGYLYFAGRADDLVKVSGQWLAPVEVEECLMRHDAVSRAVVIGVDHEGLTRPKAFIVLKDPDSRDLPGLAAELKELVKTNLAPHKYPRLVEFVDDIPRNDRGKVNRKLLRQLESEGRSGECY